MRFFNPHQKTEIKDIKKPLASLTLTLLLGFGVMSNLAMAAQEPVIANGVVPDEQTRQQILAKLKGIYGENVVDQITVSAVTMPPEWRQTVLNAIQPELKNVSKGRLEIAGSNIQLNGKVPSEAVKTALSQQMTAGIPAMYKIKQQLEINASEQKLIDQALGNRIVEFESGSAILTPVGQRILDEMAIALNKVGNKSVKIIGHTDSQGNPVTNLGLSLQRANAVCDYLAARGVNKTLLNTEGLGANQPIADNGTEEGRRRNRRIEFEVL
ncbi:MAG: OmpA family protein [Moraxellaceae bacterium]|nr:MAG: OmpA family protein [Moraxellaceae bacterium]